VTIGFALLAALCNAINVATQHIASTSDPKKSKGWRLVRYLFSSPLWLVGWLALAAAFVFQAFSLHRGEMSVVQPLLVTELVFVLVLRRVVIHQSIRAITWWAGGLTCVTLALFVAMSEPQGGNDFPSSHAWVVATGVTVGAATVLAILGMRGSGVRRAALLGSSTAIMWALVATFIKTMTQTLSQYGIVGMFAHWPVYALAASGLAAEILNQAALHVGPLSTSQPFLVIVDPIVSIALSVWIFEEYFTPNALRLSLAALGFAGMCASVTILIRTTPPTMATPATTRSTSRS
jgi:drug/metabolite transporter (DMT)-like permease